MVTQSTKQLDADQIPVIDIAPLIDGSNGESVGRDLVWAASEVGFIYVKNHGVSQTVIDHARHTGLEFFRLADAAKLEVSSNQHHHGYLKPGSTKMYDDAKIDLKESFNWGIELTPAQLQHEIANPLIGPNLWPSALTNLKSAVYPYFEASSQCAVQLLRGFALGASLPPEHFVARRDRPLSRGSLQYYPPQPANAEVEQFGVAPHTDFGVMTVLCQDAVGGLELQLPSGEWAALPPIEGTFVVNVGDLLARWSNGKFLSTPHRVINRSGRERLSLVLAYDPNFETQIDARDFCPDGESPVEAAIACGDYLLWRFEKAFAYRQAVSPT
jgi:isopenicillin N synthase-like dioxygenase